MRITTIAGLAFVAAVSPALCQVKVPACYARVYSSDHLGKHPDQLVTSMTLELSPPKSDKPEWLMSVTTRGRSEAQYTGGGCRYDGGLTCYVDCDGGDISIRPVSPGTIYVELGREGKGSIQMSRFGCTDDMNSVTLDAGKDDKIFRLEEVSPRACDDLNRYFKSRGSAPSGGAGPP